MRALAIRGRRDRYIPPIATFYLAAIRAGSARIGTVYLVWFVDLEAEQPAQTVDTELEAAKLLGGVRIEQTIGVDKFAAQQGQQQWHLTSKARG